MIKVVDNIELYGTPNTPEEDKVYWKGVDREYNDRMVGLKPNPYKKNQGNNLNFEEEFYRSDTIRFNIPSIDTFLKKPNPNKKTYSIENLKRLVQEEEASRTS